jgi:putative component of toxin-antitoxin plasmid stabilization module
VYCARVGRPVVLLLGGGDKRRQARDIEVVRNRLTDFQKRSESR